MLQPWQYRRDSATQGRHAQVLIEFSFIALILYLLMAVTFDFGRALYSAQIVQQAADFMARELSHTALAATSAFVDPFTNAGVNPNALADPTVKQNIYSEDYLAIDITGWTGTQSLLDFLENPGTSMPPIPPVNKLLVPLMIVRNSTLNPSDVVPAGKTWLVYPGALVQNPNAASWSTGYTVRIPVVTYSAGQEQFSRDPKDWLPVVEPMQPATFSVIPSAPQAGQQQPPPSGLVALRINYPFQAAGLTGYQADPSNPTQAQLPLQPIQDSDPPDSNYGPYAGPNGLGAQAILAGQRVRPFRRVISAQAIYRREIFQ